jgi:hypothetical protein
MKSLRELKGDKYQKARDEYVEKEIEHNQEKYLGPLDETSKAAEKERMTAVLDKAKAFSDADFELNKESLAKEMDLKWQKEHAKKEMKKLSKAEEGLGPVGKYFLEDRIIPILEQKIEVAKKFKKPETANLDEMEGAETYK